jgi:hypothetical protein
MWSKTAAQQFSLAFLIIAVLCARVVWAQEFVTDGLIGFWTLDKATIKGKTVNDVWGENQAQIAGGNPKMVEGRISDALEFDGASDVIQLPDLGHSSTVTIEVWLKAYSFPQYAGLVSAPTSDPGMVHFKLRSSAAVSVDKRDNANSLDSPPIAAEQWVHALFTCDTSEDKVELYVNGESIGTDISGPTPVNLTGLMIGREKSDRYFPGVLDEVRIYNRVLSEDEVLQNYHVESNSMAVNFADKITTTWGKIKQ